MVGGTGRRRQNVSMRSKPRMTGLVAVRVAGLCLLGAAGCTISDEYFDGKPIDPLVLSMYGPVEDDAFQLPAIPIAKVNPALIRQTVHTPPAIQAQPGMIVVDPANAFLYLVQDDGMSLRYGIGVGRAGFAWAGEAEIHSKQHWPKWFPPAEMRARESFQKHYPHFETKYPDGGMDGSPRNPIGARALYLWQDNKDTLYRIHATNDWQSIGTAASSGCIRMWNQDIIDLYDKVDIGTKVVVLQSPEYLKQQAELPVVAETMPGGSAPAGAGPVAVVSDVPQ